MFFANAAADIFEKIATETATLARYNKKPTVTSREIQTAGSSLQLLLCSLIRDIIFASFVDVLTLL